MEDELVGDAVIGQTEADVSDLVFAAENTEDLNHAMGKFLAAGQCEGMNEELARRCIIGLLEIIRQRWYSFGDVPFKTVLEMADKWLPVNDLLLERVLQVYAGFISEINDRRVDEQKVYEELLAQRRNK